MRWVNACDCEQSPIKRTRQFHVSRPQLTAANITVEWLSGQPAQAGYAEGGAHTTRFNQPAGVMAWSAHEVIVCEFYNHCLRIVDTHTGSSQLLAGRPQQAGHVDGAAKHSKFFYPFAIAAHASHPERVLICDYNTKYVRQLVRAAATQQWHVATLAASADEKLSAPPSAIAVDSAGTAYVTTLKDRRLLRIEQDRSVSVMRTLTSNHACAFSTDQSQPALTCTIGWSGLLITSDDKQLLWADVNDHVIRSWDRDTLAIRVLADVAGQSGYVDGVIAHALFTKPYSLYAPHLDRVSIRERSAARGHATGLGVDADW